jgi:hypothetical protein
VTTAARRQQPAWQLDSLMAAWWQRGVHSGSNVAGSAAVARQWQQQQFAGIALVAAAALGMGSVLAAGRQRAWLWQPLPPPCCHHAPLQWR